MSFYKNFLGVKAQNVVKSFTEMLVKWDPETATQAELDTMYDKFTEITKKAELAKRSFEKENMEAENIKKAYNKKVDVLRVLETKLNECELSMQGEIEKAINELTLSLEEMAPDVQRELDEANEAKEYLDEVNEMVSLIASKIKTAKAHLAGAQKRMERAELQNEKAKEREARAKEMAGLKDAASSTSVAFDALQRKATKLEVEAAASEARNSILKNLSTKSASNSLIDKIEKELNTEPESTLTERLKNIKKF